MKVTVCAYQHVAYVDDVNLLGTSKNYGKKAEKLYYAVAIRLAQKWLMRKLSNASCKFFVSRQQQNSEQNRNTKLVNRSFENVTQRKYFEALARNKKRIHEEFQSRLNSGVICKDSFRIFHLPAFCLKIETENFASNYIFKWV